MKITIPLWVVFLAMNIFVLVVGHFFPKPQGDYDFASPFISLLIWVAGTLGLWLIYFIIT